MSPLWSLSILLLLSLPFLSVQFGLEFTLYSRLTAYYGIFQYTDEELLGIIKTANTARVQDSQSYLASLNSRHSQTDSRQSQTVSRQSQTVPPSVDLVICIVTLSRETNDGYRPQYLLQSAAAFHREVATYSGNMVVSLVLCDVEEESGNHPELETIQGVFTVITRRHSHTGDTRKGMHRLEKEKQDYSYCLEEGARIYNGTKAVLMVEDDTLPLPGLIRNLGNILEHRNNNNTAFIKLFHPPRLLGYIQPEPHRWVEWVCLALLILTLDHLVFHRPRPSPTTLLLHLLLVMLLLEAVGRQTLLQLRPNYYLVPAPECCTPANVFPSSSIPKVVTALANITCKAGLAKDYALVSVVKSTGLEAWSVQPNLVTHVGAVSTLHTHINVHIHP